MISLRQPRRHRIDWEPVPDTEWKELGNCTSVPAEVADDLFFPEGGHPTDKTLRVYCAPCPVRERCLAFAVNEGLEGVWGGVYRSPLGEEEQERRRIWRAGYARQARAKKRAMREEQRRLAGEAEEGFWAASGLDRLNLLTGHGAA